MIDTNPSASLGGVKPWVSADRSNAGFIVGNVPASWLVNTHTIELTWPSVIDNWIEPRCTIANITGNNLTIAAPCSQFLIDRSHVHPEPLAPVTAEAVANFPLGPGAFYHDVAKNAVLYTLAHGQTLADLQNATWVSGAEVILSLYGVAGHTWQDVTFEFSTWYQPNTNDGFVDLQSTVYMCSQGQPFCNVTSTDLPSDLSAPHPSVGEPRGSVRVEASSDVSFINCTFTHIGTPYAISVMQSSHRVSVAGCTFSDLSGGFVKLGSVNPVYAASPSPADWDAYLSATDNVASDMAVEYGGAAGVFGGYLFSADVSHNTISDAGYSGVSVGWGWGLVHPMGCGNNTVSYNRIFDVMQRLRDGGGIYVNGATNGSYPSFIANNWVDHDESVFAVYYLDNGASNWVVTNNVASNSSTAWGYFITGANNKPAGNDHVDHFWYQDVMTPWNNCTQYNCTVDESTVYKVTGPWPAAAQAIMDRAGATP